MDYNCIITFTKRTNLLEYLSHNLAKCAEAYGLDVHSVGAMEHLREMYAEEREVRLIALIRYDIHGKTFCRIKCPINPLPIKGEFEASSVKALSSFLELHGWHKHDVITRDLLR